MTIYFAQMGDWIKIGYTANKDASRRISQLQTGQPQRIKLLGTIPGDREAEAGLHSEFADFRESGEWFRRDHELVSSVSFLIENQKPWYFSRLRLQISKMWREAFSPYGRADISAYEDFLVVGHPNSHPYAQGWKNFENKSKKLESASKMDVHKLRKTAKELSKRVSTLCMERRELKAKLEAGSAYSFNPFGNYKGSLAL